MKSFTNFPRGDTQNPSSEAEIKERGWKKEGKSREGKRQEKREKGKKNRDHPATSFSL